VVKGGCVSGQAQTKHGEDGSQPGEPRRGGGADRTCLGYGSVSVRPLWLMVMKPSSMSMLGVPYSPMVPSLTRWQSGGVGGGGWGWGLRRVEGCIDTDGVGIEDTGRGACTAMPAALA